MASREHPGHLVAPLVAHLVMLVSAACTQRPSDFQASVTASTSDTTPTTTTGPAAPTTGDTSSTTSPITSTTSESAITSDPSGTSCAFLDCSPPPDDHPRAECDLWTDACPEGQKCMPYADDGSSAWNKHKCVPIDPDPDQIGEPCTVEGNGVSGIDSCEKHAMCWNVDLDTKTGTCIGMCIGPIEGPSCEIPGHVCEVSADSILIVCFPPCDPIAQDCPGQLCVPATWDSAVFWCWDDASGVEGQVFDPCDALDACDPGLHCADPTDAIECDPMATGCCLPFCDLDDPNTCPGQGQQCVPWYDDPNDAAPFNLDVGACALPMP